MSVVLRTLVDIYVITRQGRQQLLFTFHLLNFGSEQVGCN